MALETIGFRAVIENLTGYLSGIRQMEVSNTSLARAQVNLQRITEQTAAAQQSAANAVSNAQRRLAIVQRTSAIEQATAQRRLIDAQKALESTSVEAAARIATAKEREIAAQRRFNATSISAAASIERAEKRLAAAQEASAIQRANAEVRLDKATKARAASSTANAATQARLAQRVAEAEINSANVVLRTNTRIANATKAVGDAEAAAASRIAAASVGVTRAKEATAAVSAETATRIRAAEERVALEQQRVTNAYTAKAERVAVAEAALQQATSVSASVQKTSALAVEAAQLGVVSAGGKAAKSTSLITAAFSPFTAAARVAHSTLEKFGRGLISVTGFQNRFAVAMRFGAGALVAFGGALVISQAASFQDELTKIDNLTETTTADTESLGNKLSELSKTVPKSPGELGSAAYFVLSSGIHDVGEALDITTLSAKAATIGLGNTGDIAKVVTSIINAYGEENISAAQATDILVAGVKAGSAEAQDFAQDIGRLLGIAPTLGIQFDQLVASVAALTNVGLSSSQATTALLGIMNQLISPSKEAQDALQSVGTSIEDVRAEIRDKGLLPALQDMLAKFNNNQQALETLFPEVRGLTGALDLLRDGGSRISDILEQVTHSQGITEDAFERTSKNFSFQAQILKNELSVALIELGTTILPTITNKLKELIVWIDQNRQGIINFSKAVIDGGARLIGDLFKGITTIVGALRDIPGSSHLAQIAFVGMAVAMVAALTPISPLLVGILFLMGEIANKGQGVADFISNALGLPSSTRGSEKVNTAIKNLTEAAKQSPNVEIGTDTIQQTLQQSGLPEFTAKKLSGKLALQIKNIQKSEIDAANTSSDYEKQLEKLKAEYNDNAIATDNAKTSADALSDGIIDFSEAAELGIGAVLAGALEAGKLQDVAAERAFNYTKALSLVANAFQRSADLGRRAALNMSRNALEATKNAASALFSRPTREIARLDLALTRLRITNSKLINSLDSQIAQLQGKLDALDKQDALSSFKDQQNDINDQIRDLQKQLSTAKGEERDSLKDQINDLRDQSSQVSKDEAKERQRQSIQDEIDQRQAQIDKLKNSEQAIQDQIDLYNLQNEALQKQIEASDATLLSQGQLATAAQEVADNMAQQSTIIQTLSDQLGISAIPEIESMRSAVADAQGAFQVLTDEKLRQAFIPAVDAAATSTSAAGASADALSKGADAASNSLTFFQGVVDKLVGIMNDAISQTQQEQGAIDSARSGEAATVVDPTIPLRKRLPGRARGGFVFSPTETLLGEGSKPELVLPLTDATRSRELIRSIPPSLASEFSANRQSQANGTNLGPFNIEGFVPIEVENMAIRIIRKESAKSRNAHRLIGL